MAHIAVADKHLHCYAKPCCEAGWSDRLCLLFKKAADCLCKPMSEYWSDAAYIVPAFHQFGPIPHRAPYDVHSQVLIYKLNLAIQYLSAP